MTFTLFRRNNPCPLCESHSGRCKESSDGLIFCMTFTDALEIPGYRFIKLTRDGTWGLWTEDDRHASVQDWEVRKQQRKRQRQQREAAEAQRRASAMSAEVRDQYYRKLLASLSLHPADRADLYRRGFTDDQIEEWGIKSVAQWQRLADEFPHNLPGVSLDGSSMNTPRAGYLCPIENVDGLITGCQVRTRDNDGGRYYWLTSRTKKRPNGVTPHLPNGELPLAVFQPSQIQKPWIGITEGIGAKARIAAERLGIPIIGAAGGQWAASPTTLVDSIETLGQKTVLLIPDAGQYDAKHKSVVDRYRAVSKFCCKLGYEFQVLWWEQIDKAVSDIDEISNAVLQGARLLTFAQFESIIHYEPPLEKILSVLCRWKGKNEKQRRQQQRTRQQQQRSGVHYYQSGDRLNTWKRAAEQGHRFICDVSSTGSGKSYDSGRVEPFLFGVQQVIHLSEQHRNPTTETLSANNGWVDLEARHSGLVKEATVDGGSRLRRAKVGEVANIPANCNRTSLLSVLRDKNVNGAGTATLICGTCPLKEACSQAEGSSYGFLKQRRSALSSPLVRAHPASVPDTTEYDYSKVSLIWEEFSEAFAVKRQVRVTKRDFEQVATALLQNRELLQLLQPLLNVLRSYFNGSEKLPHFGLLHHELLQKLPRIEIDLAQLQEVIGANLTFINPTGEYGVNLEDLPPSLRKQFTDRDGRLAERAEDQIIKQWLPDLLRILSGSIQGPSMRIDHAGLLLTLPDDRHRAIANAAKVNIILDATLSREDLALKLGCAPEDIFICAEESKPPSNLTITQVSDLGRMGMQRGKEQERRKTAIVNHYKALDPSAKVIDFKKFADDAAWWRDSRGVNDFLQVKTLIIVGTPCRNLADLQAEYAILKGQFPCIEDEGFKAWANRIILADIHQAIGRLRANRRTNEQLQVILINDFPIDFPVQEVKASDIVFDAATKQENAWERIIEVGKRFWNENDKIPTQTEVATETGINQSWISKLAHRFIGGWKWFKKLITSLVTPPDTSSTDSLSIDEVWAAQWLEDVMQDPPDEIANQLNTLIKTFGWQGWYRILTRTTSLLRLQLLAALFRDGIDAQQELVRE